MTVMATSTGSSFNGREVHILDHVVVKSPRIGIVFGFAEVLSTTGIRQIAVWLPGTYSNPNTGPSTPSTTDIEVAVDGNYDPTLADMPFNSTAATPNDLAFGEWMWP